MEIIDWILNTLRPFYMRILVSVIIVICGLILGKLSEKIILKILKEVNLNKLIKKATGFQVSFEKIIASFCKTFIYFIFIIWALEKIGLGSVILNILAGGIVIIIILSLILSVKDFVPNAVAGLFINLKGIIKEGEYIKTDNLEGFVINIDLVETKIKTKSDDLIYIPNSMLLKNKFVIVNQKSKKVIKK